jgi:hypothetical protein
LVNGGQGAVEADLHGIPALDLASINYLPEHGARGGATQCRIAQVVVGIEVDEPYLFVVVAIPGGPDRWRGDGVVTPDDYW